MLAAVLGAIPETGTALQDHRILILGDGANRVSIAEMIAAAMAQDSRSLVTNARRNIFLADALGLVTATSRHAAEEHEEMREVLLYAKDMRDMRSLEEVRLCSCSCCPRVRSRDAGAALRGTKTPVLL